MDSAGTPAEVAGYAEDAETQLMLRFASGDQAAFAELVDLCHAGVIQYFAYLTRDRATAEDLAQEVLIRVFQAGKGYQPRARFRTYLFRIARNLWIDHRRRDKNSSRNISLDATDEDGNGLSSTLAAPESAQSPGLGSSSEGELIRQAIEQLPEEQREVFLMSQVEGFLYEEIAETLEIPVGTVKSRMFHATRRLREILERVLK